MLVVAIIDFWVVGYIVSVASRRGLEAALPFFAFTLVILPNESQFKIPGLFDFTTARIAIITFAVLYVFSSKKRRDTNAMRSVPLKYPMLLIIVWSLLATANSIVFATSLKTVLSHLLDYFLVYYLFVKTIRDPKTTRKILLGIVAGVGVCCIFGFLEVYQNWSVISLLPALQGDGLTEDVERGLRVHSTFPHPILFGGALAMVIPITLYLLTVVTNSKQKILLWLAVMMMFWNIYKTGSRGPWLGLILAYSLLVFFSQARMRKLLLIIVLLVISVLVIRPGVRESLENTYFATMDPNTREGNSYAGRYDLIRLGTTALGKDVTRALWGYGPESFAALHLQTMNGEGHMAPAESCDDSWLALAVETGYPGMILVAVLFARALQLVLKRFFRAPKPAKDLYGLVFVNIMTFAFLMLSVAIYGWGQQSYLLWISLAVALAYCRPNPGRAPKVRLLETVAVAAH